MPPSSQLYSFVCVCGGRGGDGGSLGIVGRGGEEEN